MPTSDLAVNKFKEGYNCAQSVLFAYADRLNISTDTALKIATGFGGGMGRKQEVCGAVSGAIMVLGLIYGRGEHDGREKQEITYATVRELIDGFTKECGSINCKELLSGCELMTAEGQKRFVDEKMIERCYGYVERVCGLLDRLTA